MDNNVCKRYVAVNIPEVIAFLIASRSLELDVSSISTLSNNPSNWSLISLARFMLLTLKKNEISPQLETLLIRQKKTNKGSFMQELNVRRRVLT